MTTIARIRPHTTRMFAAIFVLFVLAAATGAAYAYAHQPWQEIGIVGVAVVVLIVWVLRPIMAWAKHVLVITDESLVFITGWGRKNRHEIAFSQIVDVNYSQSMWQRLSGAGSLELTLITEQIVAIEHLPVIRTVYETVDDLVTYTPRGYTTWR